MSGDTPAAWAIGFATWLTPLPAADINAAKRGETTSYDSADRRREKPESQKGRETPRHEAVQHAVEARFDPGQPGRDVAAREEREAAADDPPNARPDAEAAGRRRAARVRVHSPEAYARSQQAEQKLDCDDDNDAGENRGPGDTPMGMSTAAHYRGRIHSR